MGTACSSPSKTRRSGGGRFPEHLADHPVVHISWHDALAYANWLRERTDRPYRLPTEAEWEKAARGDDSRLWPWGNQEPDQSGCNFDNQVNTTTPVGQYSPAGDSPYGCADMAGNVWEWCSSQYKGYPYRPEDGRENLEESGTRVFRGGSFWDNAGIVRCASRESNTPDIASSSRGFRVARGRLSGAH